MPSPKTAILLTASRIAALGDDVSAGRIASDSAAVAQLAYAMAEALRALASQWHS